MSIKEKTGLTPDVEEIVVDRIKKSEERGEKGITLEELSEQLGLE